MSEYWVSTPKYWCKFCKTFVRDTPFEKRQHETTPKHQGNIQRSLRTMHRDKEREEREAQRAKNEVARVSGIVSGTKPSFSTGGHSGALKAQVPPPKKATEQDRKRQLQQLSDIGVAVPDEYRAEVAMAGNWQTISQHIIDTQDVKAEPDTKQKLNVGVHKRRHEGMEEEEEAGDKVLRRGWGSTVKQYPGQAENTEDIGALLRNSEVKHESATDRTPAIKKEEDQDNELGEESKPSLLDNGAIKHEDDVGSAASIVFKKRKTKATKGG